jgi:hypothetical protein
VQFSENWEVVRPVPGQRYDVSALSAPVFNWQGEVLMAIVVNGILPLRLARDHRHVRVFVVKAFEQRIDPDLLLLSFAAPALIALQPVAPHDRGNVELFRPRHIGGVSDHRHPSSSQFSRRKTDAGGLSGPTAVPFVAKPNRVPRPCPKFNGHTVAHFIE